MLIPHPLLGLRDAQEFTYLGDAVLLNRPDGMAEAPRPPLPNTSICATTLPVCIASCGFTSRATAPGWS